MRAIRLVVLGLVLFVAVTAFAQRRVSDAAGGSSAVTPASTARFVDAKGVTVGPLLGFQYGWAVTMIKLPSGETVPVMIGNPIGTIHTNDSLAASWNRWGLSYESGDCSGTALISPIFPIFKRVGVVNGPGNTLYMSDPFPVPHAASINSSKDGNGNCIVWSPQSFYTYIKVTPTLNLDTLFTPPFHVE